MVEYADYITRRANDTKRKTRTESKLFYLLLALKLLFFPSKARSIWTGEERQSVLRKPPGKYLK
jgi:hypothetical protein